MVAEELGLVLQPGEKYVVIEAETNGNLSETGSELKSGDRIVAIWGEMAAYMDVDEVASLFLASSEIRFMIERTVTSKLHSLPRSLFSRLFLNGYGEVIGAKLNLQKKGVVVNSVVPGGAIGAAGIQKGDLLYRIYGKNTRYLPMSKIVEIIKENQDKEIEIVIRRDIILWKKKLDA